MAKSKVSVLEAPKAPETNGELQGKSAPVNRLPSLPKAPVGNVAAPPSDPHPVPPTPDPATLVVKRGDGLRDKTKVSWSEQLWVGDAQRAVSFKAFISTDNVGRHVAIAKEIAERTDDRGKPQDVTGSYSLPSKTPGKNLSHKTARDRVSAAKAYLLYTVGTLDGFSTAIQAPAPAQG